MVLNRADVLLFWSRTMSAKPPKCVSMAMRQFRNKLPSRHGYIPLRDTIYSPYDPQLSISGVKFRCLLPHFLSYNTTSPLPTDFNYSHFQFRGRFTCPDITYTCINTQLSTQYWSCVSLVDSDPVNGAAKIWLYQFAILHKLSWLFMIYDFTITILKSWDSRTGVYIKKWDRIFQNAYV